MTRLLSFLAAATLVVIAEPALADESVRQRHTRENQERIRQLITEAREVQVDRGEATTGAKSSRLSQEAPSSSNGNPTTRRERTQKNQERIKRLIAEKEAREQGRDVPTTAAAEAGSLPGSDAAHDTRSERVKANQERIRELIEQSRQRAQSAKAAREGTTAALPQAEPPAPPAP